MTITVLIVRRIDHYWLFLILFDEFFDLLLYWTNHWLFLQKNQTFSRRIYKLTIPNETNTKIWMENFKYILFLILIQKRMRIFIIPSKILFYILFSILYFFIFYTKKIFVWFIIITLDQKKKSNETVFIFYKGFIWDI